MATRFLIVDDDDTLAEILKEILAIAYPEAEVRVAQDNNSAFQQLEGHVPSLITTDINHPGGDGYDFLTRLRKNPVFR